jgi:hypothetical protein
MEELHSGEIEDFTRTSTVLMDETPGGTSVSSSGP